MIDCPLHTHERGEGPLIVLLHGGSGSWTHWTRNIAPLAKKMRVVAVDLPGFGCSSDAAKDLSPAQYVRRVIVAMERLIPPGRTADLAGFSFGGVLAASVAAAMGARIRRLSLLAPGGFGVPAGRYLSLRRMPQADAPMDEIRVVVAHNLGQVMLHTPPRPDDPVVELQMSNLLRTRYDSRLVSLQSTLVDYLSRYSGPVQVIWGRKDRLAYPDIETRSQIVRSALPAARIAIVEEAGHWVQFEKSAEVNRLLLDFHTTDMSP